ncbi:hypothetical protein ACERIT_09590 [Halopenitus sp. H-Gu1]|uniref:hypothetical protein n=1 Tax=Halopenitus sp. H-Gu1 TaxID=3242697 RepID=UPI00359E0AE3
MMTTLAGCADDTDSQATDDTDSQATDDTDSQATDDTDSQATDDTDSQATDDTDSQATDGDDLDLREANVVGISFEAEDGTYTFDVALHHDDDGEDGYANWWQVERLDGTRLGRRELLHAHSQQPFTRSETIEIPADVSCVVVRGHDQTHEYGGLVTVVRLDSDETRTIDQGSEKRSFDTSDCP